MRQSNDERFASAKAQVIPTNERPPKPRPLENERVREDREPGDVPVVVVFLACVVIAFGGGGLVAGLLWMLETS